MYMELSPEIERLSSQQLADPMLPRSFEIKRRIRETADTFTLELEPQVGEPEFHFAPGQFNMLYLFGVGETAISISGDPTRPSSLVHTIRAVGTVTKKIRQLKKGDVLGVRGPYGVPWPLDMAEGNDVVLVAGGIGLAPLRPVLYQLLADRGKYGRIHLLYGTRNPADILFRRELEKWRARFDMEVDVTVDSAKDDWRGSVGVVTTLIERAPLDPFNTVAMICGPEIMMRYAIRELLKCGIDEQTIYLSMERNMKCAIGFCGRCQYGPAFICKDGPVFRWDAIKGLFGKREL